jgi:hypothetical protein
MANLGQLVVNLEANIARFTSDMGRASQATEQAMNKIDGAVEFGKKALGALGVALSVDLIVSEINRSLDSLAALDDMAQKTGSSVETLSKLSKVAAFTGTDLGAVDGMLVKLSKNLAATDEEGNKTAKALAAIGISTDDLKGKDPAQVFVQVANKLQDYEDGANKVALVTDLMGKSAADMLPYMNDVAESLDKFTGDSAESAAQAAALQDGLGQLKVKYEELKTGIIVEALPAANAFIGALQDTLRESKNLVSDTALTTWADEVALVLARMADGGALVGRTFKAVGAEIVATAANIEFMDAVQKNVNPVGAAKVLLSGGSPNDNIKAAMAKRNAIIADANTTVSALWTKPLDGFEQAMYSRIAGRFDKSLADGADALAGMVPASTAPRTALTYTGSDPKDPKKPKKEKEGWTADGAANRMVRAALDETLAIKGTIDATEALQQADEKRANAHMRAMDQNAAIVERIRQDLMTDVEHEQLVYESRLEQLRVYGDNKLGSEMAVNALVEQETARHKAALAAMDQQAADRKMQMDMQLLAQAGGVADQMYSMLQQAGLQQTALGRAAFLASKAIAVAQIIMSTNVAAAAAMAPPPLGLGPIAGLGMAGTIKALGYSSAAMTAGLAIASAEGGYDIPGGVNPVTQLHEKEMVLPKAQAEVIRGLARNGGAGGGITIHNSPQINIDSRTDQQEVRRIVADGVARGNADLVDKLSRAGRI